MLHKVAPKKTQTNNDPNEALEIICTSLAVVITFMFEFHLSGKKKKNTNHISACNSLLKYNKNILFLKQTVDGQ